MDATEIGAACRPSDVLRRNDMVTVLQTYWTECGKRYMDLVRDEGFAVTDHGINPAANGFARRDATLYSYRSPTTDKDIWVIEVEGYDPPDAQWWATTILDGRPSTAAIGAIGRGQPVAVGEQIDAA